MGAPSAGVWRGSLSRRDANWLYVGLWGINAFFLITNLLLAAGWHPPLNTIARLLDLDKPASLGKWWLSAQLLLVSMAALLLMCSRCGTAQGKGRIFRFGWPAFALITLMMSAESIARMKQDLEGAARNLLPTGLLFGFHLNWTAVFAPLILACGVFFAMFARQVLGRDPRARALALWGVGAWALSIVLEVLECSILQDRQVALQVRAFEPTIEQMLEVGGTTLLLMALVELGFAQTAARADKVASGEEAIQGTVS